MDWAALIVDPNAEYLALVELERYGLKPYLAQAKRLWTAPRSTAPVMRKFPIFPRYLLIPYPDAHDPHVRLARGICRHRCLLADELGRPWRAPAKVIDGVREAEQSGQFDEILHKGDHVTMACGVLATLRAVCTSDVPSGMIELLTPLFGGSKATVNATRIVHAS